MTHTHLLSGCRPEPLGSYLQGLGALRLVGQQADSEATGHWTDAGFVLTTALNEDELLRFFLDEYAPTPMVSPWNNDSGVRRREGSAAWKRMEVALASTSPRLAPWRQTIVVAREVFEPYKDLGDKEFKAAKESIVANARSRMPDFALEWVDAAAAVTDDGVAYAYILGTGGNLGRLDLSANVLAHLDTVIGLGQPADLTASRSWLRDALWGTTDSAYVKSAAGQFDPGRAGGLNASVLDEGDAMVNPWSFLLQLEGTLLFASGIAKRMGSGKSVAAMPFTVNAASVGSAHLTSEESAKGELWVPLWASASTLAETRRLFSEARLKWGSRPARDGIDAARAVATLGTDRGIPSFGRSAIVERLGQSPLAVPAGRIPTGQRTAVRLTSQLDPWLARVRRAGAGIRSIADGVRRVESSLMTVAAAADGGAVALQDLLHGVAEVDRRVGNNAKLRAEVEPLQPLTVGDWLLALDDGTAEFAIAWGFASLRERWDDQRRREEEAHAWCSSVRNYVRGTVVPQSRRRLAWSGGPRLNLELERELVRSLAVIHTTHATKAVQFEGTPDHRTSMREGAWTDRRIVEAFAAGRLDDRRIARLVRCLVMLDVDSVYTRLHEGERHPPVAVSPAWRLLAPLFPSGREETLAVHFLDGPSEVVLGAANSWPAMLHRNALQPVVRSATTRYRSRLGDLKPIPDKDLVRGMEGARLAAALLPAISPNSAHYLLEALVRPAHH